MTASLMTAIAKNDASLIDMIIDIGAHGFMIQFQFSTESKPIARHETGEAGQIIRKFVYNLLWSYKTD